MQDTTTWSVRPPALPCCEIGAWLSSPKFEDYTKRSRHDKARKTAEWMAEEEVRSACFDLGKCNDGEGFDWLRIAHRHCNQHWQRLCTQIEDESTDG